MDSPQQNNKENKPLTEMTKKELLEILWQALNKANSKITAKISIFLHLFFY